MIRSDLVGRGRGQKTQNNKGFYKVELVLSHVKVQRWVPGWCPGTPAAMLPPQPGGFHIASLGGCSWPSDHVGLSASRKGPRGEEHAFVPVARASC